MSLHLQPWWQDTWWIATIDRARQIARMTRTEARFEEPARTEGSLDDLERRVRLLLAPAEWGLIVDLRAVPLRVSPEESAPVRRFNTIIFRFGRIATVVRTAVGRMQMQRIAREVGTMAVFDDPEAAADDLIAWQAARHGGQK